jgi:hypothetical protein
LNFRRYGFTDHAGGAATQLAIAVKAPTTSHEVRVTKNEAWLQSSGKSPALSRR